MLHFGGLWLLGLLPDHLSLWFQALGHFHNLTACSAAMQLYDRSCSRAPTSPPHLITAHFPPKSSTLISSSLMSNCPFAFFWSETNLPCSGFPSLSHTTDTKGSFGPSEIVPQIRLATIGRSIWPEKESTGLVSPTRIC